MQHDHYHVLLNFNFRAFTPHLQKTFLKQNLRVPDVWPLKDKVT